MNKVLLTAAITGAGDTIQKMKMFQLHHKNSLIQQLNVPEQELQLLIFMLEIQKLGVSHDPELYAETVRLIREAEEDIIINITSGGGGDFIPSLEHPETGGEGTWIQTQKNVINPLEIYYQRCVH